MGVDPGLKATGFGIVEVNHRKDVFAIEAGVITPKQKDTMPQKLFKIHEHLITLMKIHQPDVLVLEKLYSHSKHPITSSIMGHVRGVICLVCAQQKISLIEESPKRVRKAVVGNGNASKEQTREMVAHLLKIDAKSLTLDASDALALALGYASMMRIKI